MKQGVATSIVSATELWSVTRSCRYCCNPVHLKVFSLLLCATTEIQIATSPVISMLKGKNKCQNNSGYIGSKYFYSFFYLRKSSSLISPLAHTQPLGKSFAHIKPILASMARDPAESLSSLKTCSDWADFLTTKLFELRYSWCWQWFLE